MTVHLYGFSCSVEGKVGISRRLFGTADGRRQYAGHIRNTLLDLGLDAPACNHITYEVDASELPKLGLCSVNTGTLGADALLRTLERLVAAGTITPEAAADIMSGCMPEAGADIMNGCMPEDPEPKPEQKTCDEVRP